MPKAGDVLFLEHQKRRPTKSDLKFGFVVRDLTQKLAKTGFLLHGNAENRRCSIFGTSKTASHQIWPQIRIPRPSFNPKTDQTRFFITWKYWQPVMFYFWNIKKTSSHQIWPHVWIPRPSFTLKPVKTIFLLHGNAENRWSSIFGISKNGVTPNLTSDSDSSSFIYPKAGENQFFITWKCRKPVKFYFWNIKNRRHTKPDLIFAFPVLHLP